jgi:hypothetical protein
MPQQIIKDRLVGGAQDHPKPARRGPARDAGTHGEQPRQSTTETIMKLAIFGATGRIGGHLRRPTHRSTAFRCTTRSR